MYVHADIFNRNLAAVLDVYICSCLLKISCNIWQQTHLLPNITNPFKILPIYWYNVINFFKSMYVLFSKIREYNRYLIPSLISSFFSTLALASRHSNCILKNIYCKISCNTFFLYNLRINNPESYNKYISTQFPFSILRIYIEFLKALK